MKNLVIAIVLLAGSAFATNYNYPVRTTKMGADSVFVTVFRGTGDSVSTTKITSFPYAGTLTLDDTCSWILQYKYWYATDTVYAVVPVPRALRITYLADTTNISKLRSGLSTFAAGDAVTLSAGEYTKIKDTAQIGTYTLAAGQFTKIHDSAWGITGRSLTVGVYVKGDSLDNDTSLLNFLRAGQNVKSYSSGEDPGTYVLATPANKIVTDGSGQVSVGSNVDKTGYALSAAGCMAVADTAWNSGSAAGYRTTRALAGTQTVTIPTVTTLTNWSKTGYSLSSSQNFNNTGTWTGNVAGDLTGGVGHIDTGGIIASTFSDSAFTRNKFKEDILHEIAHRADSGNVATIDSAALAGVTLVATVPDSLFDTLTAIHARADTLRDTINVILDTLQLYDNAGRFPLKQSDTVNMAGQYTRIKDTVGAMTVTASIDSLQVKRMAAAAIHDSLAAITSGVLADDTAGGSGDFLSTYADYRQAIRRRLGVSTSSATWYPDSTLNGFIKEAVAVVNPIVQGRVDTSVIALRYEKDMYNLDTSITKVLSVRWKKGDSTKALRPVPMDLWFQQDHQTTNGQDNYLARPSYYDCTNGLLMVSPVPTVDYDSVYVVAVKRVTDLSNSTLTLIPQQYRGALLEYLCWKVGEAKQHPMAQVFKQNFLDMMTLVRGATATPITEGKK